MLCLILGRGKTDSPRSLQQSGLHILTQRTSIVHKQHQGITLGGIIPFGNEEVVLHLHPIATRVGALFKLLGHLPNQLFLRIAAAIRLQRSLGWLSVRGPRPTLLSLVGCRWSHSCVVGVVLGLRKAEESYQNHHKNCSSFHNTIEIKNVFPTVVSTRQS